MSGQEAHKKGAGTEFYWEKAVRAVKKLPRSAAQNSSVKLIGKATKVEEANSATVAKGLLSADIKAHFHRRIEKVKLST